MITFKSKKQKNRSYPLLRCLIVNPLNCTILYKNISYGNHVELFWKKFSKKIKQNAFSETMGESSSRYTHCS